MGRKAMSPLTKALADQLYTSTPMFAKKHNISESSLKFVLTGRRSTNEVIELLLSEGMRRETVEEVFRFVPKSGEWVLKLNGKKYR
jgi:hypothetical protein